jgi:YidC/Oxa1 family membrane protein insertase
MDKNTILGFVLIAAILVGFAIMNRPNEEEIARQNAYNDSIARIQAIDSVKQQTLKAATINDSVNNSGDSAALARVQQTYADFKSSTQGEEKLITLENELVKITLTNKGGKVISAVLKKYMSQDSLPVELFNRDEANYSFTMALRDNHIINTSDLYFQESGIKKDKKGNQTLTFRMKSESAGWMDFTYSLPADDYMLGLNISSHEMSSLMPLGTSYIIMNWEAKIRQQEKGRQFEERYTSLNYKFVSDDMEKLSETKDDEEKISGKLKWIAFKNQYFSSVLIADKEFSTANLESKMEPKDSKYLKTFKSEMTIDYNPNGKENLNFKFFFGPNKYKILSDYDKGLDSDKKLKLRDLIPLGWGIFGWVNRWAIIPMFNLFSSFMVNFGLIILLMTVVIKGVLFPLTYKSYVSSAKMRVLKPEIDEINARIPADKPAERQKATMELYNKVGVSPFSGCLPTLLQLPILFALFTFFPSSIELRGQSFLWADDLSSYDAIISWNTNIPLLTEYYGNHISLFTLLMTIATLVSTKLNMANTATPDQPGAGMMKWMMYLMPIIFMFMFNSYASGLTYYYLISTLITIIQTYAIRATVDEKKLLAQLHAKRAANAKNPAKKKSGFMERLEKMQKEQEKAMRERAKKK